MGQKQSIIRPPHSSNRHSPRFLALQLEQHTPHLSRNEAVRDTPGLHLSPASAKHDRSSMPRPDNPFPICGAQSSTSSYKESELSRPHNHSSTSTNIPYLDSTSSQPILLQQDVRPRHVVPPSTILCQLEEPLSQAHLLDQRPLPVPQGGTVPSSQSMRYQGQGMFTRSKNLYFSDNTFIDNSMTSDNSMEKFLQHTIPGAAFDSSDRHPPPRCHPGTRLTIVERCKVFIVECNGKEKMRWVVGPAGVGKSAMMQMVAEEAPADASVFLSVNGRSDGTKTFATIAYQLAANHNLYQQYIRDEISRDPSLCLKALPAQFRKFIIEPFVLRHLFHPSRRFLIIIDGLDECENPVTQQEILGLISRFCLNYPSSPIVWFIASRPEPHITSFFDDTEVAPVYSKEEIMIDSDEACEDVQRYLRDELNKIKNAYPTLKWKREWPSELEFTRIATAAGGLFAYASTAVRYTGDLHYRDPVARLRHVLEAIESSHQDGVEVGSHPMAQLDALYARILSSIPADVMIDTRRLLIACSTVGWGSESFRLQCNRLGLTEDAAYGAVSHLHAVVKVPAPEEADKECLKYFHKSFFDFLFDFKRSKFCQTITHEAEQLQAQSSLRIAEQVPDDFEDMTGGERIRYGRLKSGPGFCDNILLSWPGDERFVITDSELRLRLYCSSMQNVCRKFFFCTEHYWTMPFFHLMTTRFIKPGSIFPFCQLRNAVFGELYEESLALGKLKQVPLQALDYAAICGKIDLRFMSPIEVDIKCSDHWNPACRKHKRSDELEDGTQHWRGWSTSFERFFYPTGDDLAHADMPRFNVRAGKGSLRDRAVTRTPRPCLHCSRRLARHFINNPDQLATVFVDSMKLCYVELSFVDPDDGMSQWRYRFFHAGHPSRMD